MARPNEVDAKYHEEDDEDVELNEIERTPNLAPKDQNEVTNEESCGECGRDLLGVQLIDCDGIYVNDGFIFHALS